MRRANPTPWELVGQTIRDANGVVVVSAINPCDMETRKMIVASVNTLSTMNFALECAKKKALYISRNYTTPNSLTGNMLELLAYLNAAIADTSSVVDSNISNPKYKGNGGYYNNTASCQLGEGADRRQQSVRHCH